MKSVLFFALIALASPAMAEVIPQAEATPQPIYDVLAAQAGANGEQIDGVSAWQLDLEGDGTMEWLVQPALWTGGNSVSVRTYLFDGVDTNYGEHIDIGLNRALKRVELTGDMLGLVIYELVGDDPRCCPSGESTRYMQIQQ